MEGKGAACKHCRAYPWSIHSLPCMGGGSIVTWSDYHAFPQDFLLPIIYSWEERSTHKREVCSSWTHHNDIKPLLKLRQHTSHESLQQIALWNNYFHHPCYSKLRFKIIQLKVAYLKSLSNNQFSRSSAKLNTQRFE